MSSKYPLWKALNAQLKVVGSTTKLRALDEFRAKAKLKDDWCTLHASYQPREGRIAGLRVMISDSPGTLAKIASLIKPTKVTVLNSLASDHLPLVGEFVLPPKPASR